MWQTYRLWQQDLLPGKYMGRKMVFNAFMTIFGFVMMCIGLFFLIIEMRVRMRGGPLLAVRYLPLPLSSVVGFFITLIAYRRTRYYTYLFEDVRTHLQLSLVEFQKRDELALRQLARRMLRERAERIVAAEKENPPYHKVRIEAQKEFELEYHVFLTFGLIENVGYGEFFRKPKFGLPDD